MKWCIETLDGEVIEVSNLIDKNGNNTEELLLAEVVVIKFAENCWAESLVKGAVHRIQ